MTIDEVKAMQSGNTLRTVVVLLGIIGVGVAAYAGVVGEVRAAVTRHEERPHTGAVPTEQYRIDVSRLEKKIDRLGAHAMGQHWSE